MDLLDHMEHLNSGEQSEAGPCPQGFMAVHADFLPVPFIPQGPFSCVAGCASMSARIVFLVGLRRQ